MKVTDWKVIGIGWALLLTLVAVAIVAPGRDQDAKATTLAGAPLAREYRGTTDVKYKTPADNVRYPCGSLTVPPGSWRISYRVMAYSSRPPSDLGTVSAFAVLTAPGLPVPEFQTGGRAGGNLYRGVWTLAAERVVTLTDSTTFTLSLYQSEGGNWDSLQCLGERSNTIIRAEAL